MKGSEDMGTWKEHIDKLKSQWIGKEVVYENEKHKVVDVELQRIVTDRQKSKNDRHNSGRNFKYKRKLTLCCNTTPVQGNSGSALKLV